MASTNEIIVENKSDGNFLPNIDTDIVEIESSNFSEKVTNNSKENLNLVADRFHLQLDNNIISPNQPSSDIKLLLDKNLIIENQLKRLSELHEKKYDQTESILQKQDKLNRQILAQINNISEKLETIVKG